MQKKSLYWIDWKKTKENLRVIKILGYVLFGGSIVLMTCIISNTPKDSVSNLFLCGILMVLLFASGYFITTPDDDEKYYVLTKVEKDEV